MRNVNAFNRSSIRRLILNIKRFRRYRRPLNYLQRKLDSLPTPKALSPISVILINYVFALGPDFYLPTRALNNLVLAI